MKGFQKLRQLDDSTPRMARAVPELHMQGAVMVRLLRIAGFGLGNFFEPVFRELGLSENTYHVLCLLLAEPDGTASPSELSEMVGTSRANMTRLIEQLERARLVSRRLHPVDARRHVISISDKGRKTALSVAPLLQGPIEEAFSDLSNSEFAVLQKLLRKLIVSLDKQPKSVRAVA